MRININIFHRAIIALLMLICATQARAVNIEVIIEESPPFQFMQYGKPAGMSIEVVERVLAIAELDYTITPMNWARAFQYVQRTPNSILLSVARTSEREDLFHWLAKIDTGEFFLWSRSDYSHSIDGLQTLIKPSISVVRNDHKYDYLIASGHIKPQHLMLTNSQEQAVLMLAKNRVEFTMAHALVFSWRVKGLGFDIKDFKPILQLDYKRNDLYVALSKATPAETVRLLHQAKNKLTDSGELEEILRRWH